MLLLSVYVLLVVPSSYAALHPISPCPNVFSYEGTQPEYERWYGIVLLSTDESLVGVRIDVKLDRPAEILVSWMGKVTTEDNERFTILSLDQKLHPGPAVPSRFMVKFNAVKGSPQVRTIRLNGRQICPPDPNFATDVQPNNQDHLYENRYTTEKVTRRPDLDFDDDWTNSRPATSSRPGSSGDSYKPSRPQNSDSYSSHEQNTGYSSSHNTGYSSNVDKGTIRTTTDRYNSHESYGGSSNHRPSSGTSNNYTSGHRGQSTQTDMRPLVAENTDYNDGARPSITISINKDVTYNVRPDAHNYNSQETSGGSRPSTNREPSYSSNHGSQTTEHSGGIRDEYYGKPTTKKPGDISSIDIHIHSGENTHSGGGSSYSPSKTTTRRPTNNKNTSSKQPTHRPSTSNSQRPSSSNGYQGTRPNRNPETSSENYGQNSYNSREKTTERPYQSNYGNSNHKTTSAESSGGSRPSPVPSSRPSGGAGNIPRPHATSRPSHGDEGDLEVVNSNVKCGRVEVSLNATPLITHGQNTARGQWPWHIALYRIEGINLSYSCGGSLISSTLVITAAHCVTKAPRDRPVDAEILVVQLGKYHLYQFSDDSVQNKQVRDIYVHPRYNSTNYLDDLAILVLSSPAEFTRFVRPVCLWPKNNFNLRTIDNMEGTVVGWGYDENNQVTEELKMARMPVVSYVTCITSYPQFFSQFTAPNKTFCAGFRQGTSVCNGDSGGGMVFQRDSVWYLRGLVSITVAKQGLRVCDTNHYVVFTDIANYINWIQQYLS